MSWRSSSSASRDASTTTSLTEARRIAERARGTHVPQSYWARWIADVAGIPLGRVQAAGAAARQLRGSIPVPSLSLPEIAPNPDDQRRIESVLSGSHDVDRATLEWIRACLAQHRTAEDNSTGIARKVGPTHR